MDYAQLVERIRRQNKPLLDAFRRWLEAPGLSAETAGIHVDSVDFFTEYLVYYEPMKTLAEADAADVYWFCANWFPHKAMWASAASARANMTAFRKFARFMVVSGHWPPEREQAIRETLEMNRSIFIAAAQGY